MAYRMIKYVIIEVISFLLVYGRKAIFLIDKSYNLSMRDYMMQIVKEVFHIREKA